MVSNIDLPSEIEIRNAQKNFNYNSKAVENLIYKTTPYVLSICYKWCRPPIEVEDIAQEALYIIAKKINTFKGDSAYSTWVYTLTYRVFLDRARKENRRKNIASFEPINEDAADISIDSSPKFDAAEILDDAMSKLDDKQRSVILMVDLLGYDYEKVANELSIPIGTVRSRLARARANLEKILKDRN